MKDELSKLKEKVETVTTATVDGMVKKVISYASRPVTEFNKHEVVEMMETLYHTAHDRSDTKEGYFRLAYHTIRGKIELPKEQLRHLVLRMVGDKDHERIFDIVAKVEKQSRSTARNRFQDSSPYQRPRSQVGGAIEIRCFGCQQLGHIRARCPQRGRGPERKNGGRAEPEN